MLKSLRLSLRLGLALLVVLGGSLAFLFSSVQPALGAPLNCSTPFLIDTTFTNGARWRMCWTVRAREGIIFTEVFYTPPGGIERAVLYRASLAEIHVPYDDGNPRFSDLSQYGLGGSYLATLAAAECPNGTLLPYNSRNVVCQKIQARGHAYRYTTQRQGQQLVILSASRIGNYHYLPVWLFNDDGSIEPSIQATGALYSDTSNATYGWPVGPGNTDYRTSHAHNYYWRLDFDINGVDTDVVEQFDFTGENTSNRAMTLNPITTEAARQFGPNSLRFWRIKDSVAKNSDNHAISYEIQATTEAIFRGPSYEPWTLNDFYVSQYKDCELLAANNTATYGCSNDVNAFINSEALTDPVIWYGLSFHHVARDEETPQMPTHWTGFSITPRDLTSTNPQ